MHRLFTDKNQSCSRTRSTTLTEVGAPSNENDLVVDESVYDLVERDEDGNIIKTVFIHDEDNCVETYTYDKNGKITSKVFENINHGETHEEYYDENGIVIKTITNHSWGTLTQTFDSNGNMTSEIHDDKEKDSYLEQSFVDGVLIKRYSRNLDEEQTQTFDSNGNTISEVIDNKTENSYSESYWTYYDDGCMASYCVKLTDSYYSQGYYKEEQYYQSGVVSMSYEVSQYGDNKFYYDTSGNPTRYEGKDNNGCLVETVYHSDGSSVSRIYESNGKVRIETCNSDGSLTVTYE